jgi:hypothetical protein
LYFKVILPAGGVLVSSNSPNNGDSRGSEAANQLRPHPNAWVAESLR